MLRNAFQLVTGWLTSSLSLNWKAAPRFFDMRFSHWIQALLAAALLVVAGTQAWIYFNQANIMRGQLNEMELARRPWVTTDISIPPTMSITFENTDLHITTQLILRNTGQSPAVQTSIATDGFPSFIGLREDAFSRTRATCKAAEAGIDAGISPAVFPGENKPALPALYETTIPKSRIEEFWSQYPDLNKRFQPVVIICIAYRSYRASDIHHTPHVLWLRGRTKAILTAADFPMPAVDSNLVSLFTGNIPPD